MQTVVVGAGVVGLAVARELSAAGDEVVVIEAEASFGRHASSRNSEVIHAGIYYPPGSLKARCCIEGKALLYAFCDAHEVPHRRIGKLIVATDDDQLSTLRRLRDNAAASGMEQLQWLDEPELRAREPDVRAKAALFSPSTGIVDAHVLMQRYVAQAEANGTAFAWSTAVARIESVGDGFEVSTATETIRCRRLVNAAGHGAQPLAARTRGLDPTAVPELHLVKGNYFALRGRCGLRHLVYPTPSSASLGVHLTFDLQGRARFGPDQQWVDALDYEVDPARADAFYEAIRRYWPALADDALVPDYAGIRVKTAAEGMQDFVVWGPAEHGVPNLVNLFGIESPGLTASLALAQHVATQLQRGAA